MYLQFFVMVIPLCLHRCIVFSDIYKIYIFVCVRKKVGELKLKDSRNP